MKPPQIPSLHRRQMRVYAVEYIRTKIQTFLTAALLHRNHAKAVEKNQSKNAQIQSARNCNH